MDCQQQIVNAVLWTLEIEVAVAVVGVMLYKIWEAFQNIGHRHDVLQAYVTSISEQMLGMVHKELFKQEMSKLSDRIQHLEMLRIDDMAGKTTATVIPSPKRRRR